MNLSKLNLTKLLVSAFLAIPLNARADVVFTMESTSLKKEKPGVELNTVSITEHKLRVESTGAAAAHSTIIYRGDLQEIWMVDNAKHVCTVFNKDSMKEIQSSLEQTKPQMTEMKKEMDKQMASLPPEQRKQIEAMMKSAGNPMAAAPAKPPPTSEVKNSGERKTIDGHSCLRYDLIVGGAKEEEIWTTDWAGAGVNQQYFAVVQEMAQMMEDAFKDLPGFQDYAQSGPFSGYAKIDGFPMLARRFERGVATQETKFKSAEARTVEASSFELPAGYTKRGIMDGMSKGPK